VQDAVQDLLDVARAELLDRHLDRRAVAELGVRRHQELPRVLTVPPHMLRVRDDTGQARRPRALGRRQSSAAEPAFERAFGHEVGIKARRASPSGWTPRGDPLQRPDRETAADLLAEPAGADDGAAEDRRTAEHVRYCLHPHVKRCTPVRSSHAL
jgi:hypothetical protein